MHALFVYPGLSVLTHEHQAVSRSEVVVAGSITINSNLAALNAQRRLGQNTQALEQCYTRLSSGLRINRASDDAAGLALSESLNVDGRVYSQAIRNVNDGVSFLNVAEGATRELTGILIRMRELSTQAANGTYSDTQRQACNVEAQALRSEYNRVVESTDYNDTKIFTGSLVTLQCGYGGAQQLNAAVGEIVTVTVPDQTLTTGDGTFGSRSSFTTDNGPDAAAVGDFNKDGKVDLAVTQINSHCVTVLFGNGNGTFQKGTSFPTGNSPYDITAADFDADGVLDLVTVDYGSPSVSVFLGNANGTFKARMSIGPAGSPKGVITADFNKDGKLDIGTAAGPSGFGIYLGNGNGTFQGGSFFAGVSGPRSPATGDFNKDGNLDIVGADAWGNCDVVLLGNGNGTFSAKTSVVTGGSSSPFEVAVGDFNGDGNLDFASADSGSSCTSVFLGTGNGTFQARISFATGSNPQGLAARDLNGDSVLDLVTSNNSSNTFSVLIGNGNGTFKATEIGGSTLNNPVSVTAADLNNDNILDIVTTDKGSNCLGVFLGDTQQTITPGYTSTTSVSLNTMESISIATRTQALAAQTTLDGYLDDVAGVVGIIGASMSRLQTGVSNLQSLTENIAGARSRITDADVAEEAGKLVKTQILQQASTAVLAQANQMPALALTLLRSPP
jgi:flagellin-like hook-associated protein FlgL